MPARYLKPSYIALYQRGMHFIPLPTMDFNFIQQHCMDINIGGKPQCKKGLNPDHEEASPELSCETAHEAGFHYTSSATVLC